MLQPYDRELDIALKAHLGPARLRFQTTAQGYKRHAAQLLATLLSLYEVQKSVS